MHSNNAMMMRMLLGMLTAAGVLVASGVPAPAYGQSSMDGGTPSDAGTERIVERDTTAVKEKVIEGSPNLLLRMTRLDSLGRRKLELITGGSTATFVNSPTQYPLGVEARYATSGGAGYSLLCTLVATVSSPGVAPTMANPVETVCGVKRSTSAVFDASLKVPGQPYSFFHDLCLNEAGSVFKVLTSAAKNPLYAAPMVDGDTGESKCMAYSWTSASGWSAGTPSACDCSQLNGKPAVNPCYVSPGTWVNGQPDFTGIALTCNDNNPATIDRCTGNASGGLATLCIHEVP
jgi:hypothetical protein